MRVIISTQGTIPFKFRWSFNTQRYRLFAEPTVVPPVLLDLCTVTILHRFSSPSWWTHLEKHVSADFAESDAFDKVVKLQVSILLLNSYV